MRWFGLKPWGPLCDDCERAPTPAGAHCVWCDELVQQDEDGVLIPHISMTGSQAERPLHWECNMRHIVGGVNHQRGRCTCCGGTEPPDPQDVSIRDAAKLAVMEFAKGNEQERH